MSGLGWGRPWWNCYKNSPRGQCNQVLETDGKETDMLRRPFVLSLSLWLTIALCTGVAAGALKTHRVFSSNMVIQRDKSITIWGWSEPGGRASVQFG